MSTTTTTNPYPNIAPPAGAEALCDWADWDNEFRFVTNNRRVDGTNFVLSPCAAQLPDGSIDTDGHRHEATRPTWRSTRLVDGRPGTNACGSTSKDARKLAQALLEAVDELDRWATT